MFNENEVPGNTALHNVRGLLKDWGSLPTNCFNWFLFEYTKNTLILCNATTVSLLFNHD